MNQDFFKNKFRILSNRLQNWDYSDSGWYYITVCVKNRICCLSKINNRKIYLSKYGEIIKQEWVKSSIIRKNVVIDEFTVMPNHFHGIIVIKKNVETTRRVVSKTSKDKINSLQSNSLGSIIGQFKSISTKIIRRNGLPAFTWQLNYYDHIIRTEQELFHIRNYIRFNHLDWNTDEHIMVKSS